MYRFTWRFVREIEDEIDQARKEKDAQRNLANLCQQLQAEEYYNITPLQHYNSS